MRKLAKTHKTYSRNGTSFNRFTSSSEFYLNLIPIIANIILFLLIELITLELFFRETLNLPLPSEIFHVKFIELYL